MQIAQECRLSRRTGGFSVGLPYCTAAQTKVDVTIEPLIICAKSALRDGMGGTRSLMVLRGFAVLPYS
ncbi:hypothetical protein LshimejAT787_0407200 [Lyophyllum shimeji]|uniref:Uncharacterized protein n=1 Tax=Lyophyllum shimeji TaxID=47721 RepID=A0A9P3PLJ1_LYOSH|nr:hypothetical protein LshimejAT787_0407200 [Lyophyllum shimeji]